MDARLNIYQNPVSVKFLKHIRAASKAIMAHSWGNTAWANPGDVP